MVGSDHATSKNRAARVFTDREKPTELFERALSNFQPSVENCPDAYRALVWYGVGGQGKTELRKEFCRRVQARQQDSEKIALGIVDFDTAEHRSMLGALLKLRAGLGRGRRVIFPTFDFAYIAWFALARPGADIRTAHPELFAHGESEIVDDLLAWIGDATGVVIESSALFVPGASLLYKYGYRLTGTLRRWWDARPVKAKIAEIAKFSEPEILERLPVYMGFDLWRALQEADAPRIVVMLDSYEALWRDAIRQNALLTDEWVHKLVEASPGILFAIFGRDKLRWGEVDPDWNRILDQHLLGGLSDEDATRFLFSAGVESPQVRARIIQGAQGLPFYLDLALDQFEDAARRGNDISPSEFGDTPTKVLDRFLKHLPDEEENELIVASYAEAVDERLFYDLAGAFLGGAATADWPRLKRRSFMALGEGGELRMHALMREALQDRERTERFETYRNIQQWLFDRYDALAQPIDARSVNPDHELALAAAARHLRAADSSHYVQWFQARIPAFFEAARYKTLDAVLAAGIAGSAGEDLAWSLHQLGVVRRAMGRHQDVEPLLKQALEIKIAKRGENDPDTAETVYQLGKARQAIADYAGAEDLYKRAQRIYEGMSGMRGRRIARILHSLATVRHAKGDFQGAEALYLEALELHKLKSGDGHADTSSTVHQLASLYQDMGRYQEAEEFLLRALTLKEAAVGRRHPDTAAALSRLGAIRYDQGHYEEAESLYLDTLEIYRETLGERHPHTATALHNLASVRQVEGRLQDAASLFNQALEINTSVLGERHPDTADTLQALGLIQYGMNHYHEAEEQFRRVLEIYREAFGDEHPRIATALHNLASARMAMGQMNDAERMFRQALSISGATGVWDNPDMARTRQRLAEVLRTMCRTDEALAECNRASSVFELSLQPSHPWLIECRALRDSLGRPHASRT